VRPRRLGVEAEAGTPPFAAALREVVVQKQQHASPLADLAEHPGGQHFAEMRPAQVEASAEVAERLDQSDRRAGGIGQVQAAIHALHRRKRGRMHGSIALARQHGLGGAEGHRMLRGACQQPVDALRDRLGVDAFVGNHARGHGGSMA
jgi:hypothetical protein